MTAQEQQAVHDLQTLLAQKERQYTVAWQWAARLGGYPLVTTGWLVFAIGLLGPLLQAAAFRAFGWHIHPNTFLSQKFNLHSPLDHLQTCTFLIVPGWLLLRFAAGLFPFSGRLFRWQKKREQI